MRWCIPVGHFVQAQQVLFQMGKIIRQPRVRRLIPLELIFKLPFFQSLHQVKYALARA